jgi:hypothetical protein
MIVIMELFARKSSFGALIMRQDMLAQRRTSPAPGGLRRATACHASRPSGGVRKD